MVNRVFALSNRTASVTSVPPTEESYRMARPK